MATINAPPAPVNAGAALRAILSARDTAGPPLHPPPESAHTVSRSTDAVNFILSATGVPATFRAFVDVVIGAASARLEPAAAPDDWFEARDLDLGKRARQDRRDDASAIALKKWTQRQRKGFFAWQEKAGLTLIECEPGGMDDERNNHDSRYRAPLLTAAGLLLKEAESDPNWQANPDRAMEAAAQIVIAGLPGGPAKRERFRRPRKDSTAIIKRNLATIESLFKKNLDLLARKAGVDADKVIASAEQHYTDAIERMQAALGDVVEHAERAKSAERASTNTHTQSSRDATTTTKAHVEAQMTIAARTETTTGPVDKCVHTPLLAVAPAAAPMSAVSDCNEGFDPMDRCVHTPLTEAGSVHSLNTDRSGQTQGGCAALLDVVTAEAEASLPSDPMDRCVHTPLDRLAEALADVACFEQVGVKCFDVSLVGEVMRTGERELAGFWASVPVDEFLESLPQMLDRCGRVRLNLIVRPRAPGVRLVQLDDLDGGRLAKVQRCAFRCVETSPGNYQAWIGVRGADEEIERQLKRESGADVGANGATRLAGSLNVKECYRETS